MTHLMQIFSICLVAISGLAFTADSAAPREIVPFAVMSQISMIKDRH